jgi:hypothetical protein
MQLLQRIISGRSTLKSVIQTSPGFAQQRSKPRRGIQTRTGQPVYSSQRNPAFSSVQPTGGD